MPHLRTLATVAVLCTLSITAQTSLVHADSPPEEPTEPAPVVKNKRPLLAAGLNFFIPGTGYIYNGRKPLYVSVPMILGAGGLTYAENFHRYGESGQTLLEYDRTAFLILFGSVLVLNTGLAIDAYREAVSINDGVGRAGLAWLRRARIGVAPMKARGGRVGAGMTLQLGW